MLLGVHRDDDETRARQLADKVAKLRVFADSEGRFNLSALDVGAKILLVSQFTLYADASRGRRPSFTDAAPPDLAEPLVDYFARCLESSGLEVKKGVFGAHMMVELVNDGPVTIWLEA